METTQQPSWIDESSGTRGRGASHRTRGSQLAGEGGDDYGIELSRLGSYAMVIGLMAGCMLLSAWSRIDLRETAVAIGRSERAYSAALAEASRLKLELATLEDPAWLTQAASALSLDRDVPVVHMLSPAQSASR